MKRIRADGSISPWQRFRPLGLALLTGALGLVGLFSAVSLSTTSAQQLDSISGEEVTFPVRRPFGTGADKTIALAVGDMDGDGDLDIIAGNRGEASSIALNDGHGNFPAEQLLLFGAKDDTSSLAAGDLDGDGDLDVVVGYGDGSSDRYLNDGTGHLAQAKTIVPPQRPGSRATVALGDMNGDGYFDVVLARKLGETLILLNDGAAHFPLTRTLGASSYGATSLALGDVDGTGSLDVVLAPVKGAALIFYDSASSQARDRRTIGRSGDQIRNITLGNFDGNAGLDILVSLYATGDRNKPHILYTNQGNQNFATSARFGDGAGENWAVATGDLNGDGLLDLAVGLGDTAWLNRVRISSAPVGLTRALTAGFGPPGQATRAIALADVNDDGFLDIVTGNEGHQNIIYLNGETPAFSVTDLEQGREIAAIALGDVNRDGQLDIVSGVMAGATRENVVFVNEGPGRFRAEPFGAGDEATWALAVADFNGDGALDVAAGNVNDAQNAIYFNDGLGHFPLEHRLPISSPGSLASQGHLDTSLAVGDLDGAHGIDLVTCSSNHGCGVYSNDGAGRFSAERSFVLGAPDNSTTAVAIADLNGDGRLDIVVGNRNDWNYVYLNDGQGEFPNRLRRSFGTGSDYTRALAVADVNGDSKPDILVGNFFNLGTIYLNDGAGNFPARLAQSFGQSTDRTYSIAAGDVNGDGTIDFVAGNWGTDQKAAQNVLYLNDGNGHFVATTFRDAYWTRSVALGDMDGNGAVDVIEGNRYGSQRLRIHYNQLRDSRYADNRLPIVTFTRPVTTPNAAQFSSRQIVDTQRVPLAFTLKDDESETVGRVAIDYSLDGGGHWTAVSGRPTDALRHLTASPGGERHQITWDVGQSGVIGRSDNTVLRIRAYAQPDTPTLKGTYRYTDAVPNLNQWPYVTATTLPFSVQGTLVAVYSGTVPSAGAVVYRLPAGKERGAEPLGGHEQPYRTQTDGFLPGRAEIKAGGTVTESDKLIAIWPSAEVTDTTAWRFNASSDAFPLRMTATSANPLRSRLVISDARRIADIQVWVDISATLPISVALVLEAPNGDRASLLDGPLPAGASLCADESRPTCGVETRRIFTSPLTTAAAPLADGTWILEASTPDTEPVQLLGWGLALKLSPLHYTSARPTVNGLAASAVTAGGVQTLTVSSENPLLLFDLNVALEWNASNDAQYTARLSADLRRTSELLYDWTNGQVALGNVRIYHDARRSSLPDGANAWNNAHIRIYASNRLRPNADQGGIVSQVFSETVQSVQGSGSTAPRVISYLPGQVRMGLTWNRYGDATAGNLGDDWPAALAHELGHYLLFLDDDYLTLADDLLIPLDDTDCPGAMNNPYSNAYSEFHPDQGWKTSNCVKTLSELNTQRSDWETIVRFYPELNAPTGNFTETESGPSLLPLAVTQISFQAVDPAADPMTWLARLYGQPGETPESVYRRFCVPTGFGPPAPNQVVAETASPVFECPAEAITSTQPLEVPIFYLKGLTPGDQTSSQARAYLFQGMPYPTLIDLGQPTGDQVTARGARPNDRLCVYDLINGQVGCEAITPGDDQLEMQQPAGWQPQIIISPESTRTLQISVTLPNNAANAALTLTARLYPTDGPAPAPITLTHQGCLQDGCVYGASLTSAAPVLEGYVLVGETQGLGLGTNPRQAVAEFAVGGNPVRIGAIGASNNPRSVRMRGLRVRMRGLRAPAASVDGQVMVYPDEEQFGADREWSFTLQPATWLQDPISYATPIGRAYWLAASEPITDFGRSSIAFEYLQSDVPAGEEAFIHLYFWEANAKTWRILDGQKLDLEHNLISARLVGPGLYALFSHIDITLQPGWNLLGYPVQTAGVPAAARPISAVLASIAGSYSAVYGFDAADAADSWKLYAPVPGPRNDLATLEFSHGYWIHITATEPITLHLRGAFPGGESLGATPTTPTAWTRKQPLRPPLTLYGLVNTSPKFAPAAGMSVLALVDGAVCGRGRTRAETTGLVYEVTVAASDSTAVARCGSLGKNVLLFVGGQAMSPRIPWSDNGLQHQNLIEDES